MKEKEKPCCPKFDPTPWEEKEIVWKDKLFVQDNVKAIMHMPLNMGAIITKMSNKIEAVGAAVSEADFMILSYEVSPWKSDQLIPVTKAVEGMENVKISGTFLTKVFEGPYKEAANWYKEMTNYVKGKGKEPKKLYFYYTTCPKCAKIYGKNYVVALAQV
jgi:effector-binding domain-containing protein